MLIRRLLEWFSRNHKGLDFKEGDRVFSTLGHFKCSTIKKIRIVNGHPEGHAVTIDNSGTEYWSKYLRKCL